MVTRRIVGLLLALGVSLAMWAAFALCLYAGVHRDGQLYAVLRMAAVFVGVVALGLLILAPTTARRERVRR